MDRAEQKELLIEYVNDDSLERWDESTRNRYLNIWYKKILNDADWIFLQDVDTSIVTTPGVNLYSKPVLIQKILGVYVTVGTSRFKLSQITRSNRDNLGSSTATGRPTHYFLMGDRIFFYCVPDQAYNITIEYITAVTDMEDDTDEPIFDSDFHYLIPLGAASSLKKTSGGSQINEGADLIQEYLAGLDRMKQRLLPGADDRPLAFADVWDQNVDEFGQE